MPAPTPPRTPPPCPSGPKPADLERLLSAVEAELEALGASMKRHDGALIDHHAAGLRDAMTRAIDGFTQTASEQRVPAPLRARLQRISAQVAAQRESLTRATVALDSVMAVLLPRAPTVVYAQPGPRALSRLFAPGA